jgi:hypothetical protein
MTDQQLGEWVAEQVARFQPGDLDAGLEIVRNHLRRTEAAAGQAA